MRVFKTTSELPAELGTVAFEQFCMWCTVIAEEWCVASFDMRISFVKFCELIGVDFAVVLQPDPGISFHF